MTLQAALDSLEQETIEWRNSDKAVPRRDYWAAIEGVIDTCCDQKLLQPEHYGPAKELIDAYVRFLDSNPTNEAGPPQSVLRALDQVRQAKPQNVHRTEPLEELAKLPNMLDSQMAEMHGLSVHQVRQILNNKEKYPKGHQTPEEARRFKQVRQELADYKASVLRWTQRPVGSKTDTATAKWVAPPESIEELLNLPHITVEQIARMWNKPVEEIQAIKDGRDYIPPEQEQGGELPEISEDEIQREVYANADAGKNETQIAEILGIPEKRVRAVLKDRPKQKA